VAFALHRWPRVAKRKLLEGILPSEAVAFNSGKTVSSKWPTANSIRMEKFMAGAAGVDILRRFVKRGN